MGSLFKTSNLLRCCVLSLPLLLYVFFYTLARSDSDTVILFLISVAVYATAVILLYLVTDKTKMEQRLMSMTETSGIDNRLPVRSIIIVIFESVICMGVFSQSSPLYPTNTWGDANLFFTVTKSMIHGNVLYRDIFDQKGPFLYFLHVPAVLVSDTSFIGVYILETICFAVFLLFLYKTAALFTKPGILTDILFFLVSVVICSADAFCQGDSAEELMLPVYSVTIYIGLKNTRLNKLPDCKDGVVTGALASLVFWTKYTLCGVFLGFVVFIVAVCVRKKQIRSLMRLVIAFVIGFVIVSLPVFVYFAANGALNSLVDGYFYDNLFRYSGAKEGDYEAMPLLVRVVFSFIYFFANCEPVVFLMMFTGFFFLARLKNSSCFAFAITSLITSIIGVFIGGYTIRYYVLMLYAFVGLFIIPCSLLINAWADRKKKHFNVLLAVGLLLCPLITLWGFSRSDYTCLILTSREALPQYRFAKIINSSDDRTLINYGFLDGGFYLATDTNPFIRHYCMFSSDSFRMEEQNQVISEQRTQYIVTCDMCPEFEGYSIIDQASLESTFTGIVPEENGTYYLYKLD